ncbi:copper chaperone PCu(A)C [Mycetocola reblochoni]|uniref:Copper metallochaperone, bacterial analog of Cox17 protein n=2 Tax=Mycetocola reblochoni TaxID=331618 RepID=A0A1R4ITG2_9MICO|nr:copper chaperone PCu(A)C [Mycetocola reblochoni]RLP71066.1 copper chaperone PCu(A)C [Mycetocola reblochoni]SJN23004.1 Copper metallochaperone, bacterial analog of Cox17 protein [Mycetocola reblochoni REB411]
MRTITITTTTTTTPAAPTNGTPRRRSRTALLAPAGAAVAAVLLLSSCSAGSGSPSADPSTPSSSQAEALDVSDAWVKSAESGMSAAFGELSNTGDTDITLVSVTTPASSDVELHETVADESGTMVMREKDGGFTIPAGGSRVLEPGGDHIMLMDLAEPILAGDEVSVELSFSDGSVADITAPVKDYSGANENYDGSDGEHSGHDGHEG